nr:DNA gyrase inhibitor YacG [Thiohalomonas denitrificans]
MLPPMTPTVHCPTCGRPVRWEPEQKWRPFCSERCKLIDLGAWSDEDHRIPGEPVDPWEITDRPPDSNSH